MKELDRATQAAVREVNRKLQQQIRNDWEFPSSAAQIPDSVPALATPDPPLSSGGSKKESLGEDTAETGALSSRRPLRERYYGTTDDSSGEDNTAIMDEAYTFDSPDSVGDDLNRRGTERRKRKRKEMEDEMPSNPGLCFFLRRRNEWTGAIPRESIESKPRATSSDSSPAHTPTSMSSGAALPSAISDTDMLDSSIGPDIELSPWIPPWHASSFAAPNNPSTMTDVLIPVAPPLIPPTNPVRISLNSRSSSELYNKIVRDSRTPAVPVNLSNMTRIIVQGWKDEGNWPPKGLAPEASIAARRGRVRKTEEEGGGLLAHHPHLQRGVEGMKRVFRLSSGSHDLEGVKGVKSPTFGKKEKEKVVKGDVGSAFRSHE